MLKDKCPQKIFRKRLFGCHPLLFFVPLHRKEFKNRTSTNLEPKII